jgi:hypothetical protein
MPAIEDEMKPVDVPALEDTHFSLLIPFAANREPIFFLLLLISVSLLSLLPILPFVFLRGVIQLDTAVPRRSTALLIREPRKQPVFAELTLAQPIQQTITRKPDQVLDCYGLGQRQLLASGEELGEMPLITRMD